MAATTFGDAGAGRAGEGLGVMEITEAAGMARDLLDHHGLQGWQVVFDGAKTRAGICRADRRQIGLSRPITRLHSPAEVRDTVLHEVAHALVGVEHGHDRVWRARARAIGCSGQRCVAAGAALPPGRWRGVCPAGHETTRHRQPVRVASCALCSRRFDPAAVLRWQCDGRDAPMHPRYLAELATLHAATLRPSTARRGARRVGKQ